MTDALNARAYRKQIERWRRNATREASSIQAHMARISQDLADGSKVTIALGEAKNMARDVAELIAALSAVAVLEDMQFVVEGPDAEEATAHG